MVKRGRGFFVFLLKQSLIVMKNFRLIFAIVLFALCAGTHAQQRLLGGDISLLPSYEEAGTVYRDEKGKAVKPLEYFECHSCPSLC